MKKRNGFTLIELMIVIAIFSLLILSIYSAFRTGLLSHEKIDAATNLYQKARLSLGLIETELRNGFVYTELDDGIHDNLSGTVESCRPAARGGGDLNALLL